MFTIGTIVSTLGTLALNAPSFIALGVDLVDAFNKGKALIESDTASTPEERAAAMAEISALESQRDSALEALRLQAPNS
jgi:hypothetical protein